jgi:hypothetical protein
VSCFNKLVNWWWFGFNTLQEYLADILSVLAMSAHGEEEEQLVSFLFLNFLAFIDCVKYWLIGRFTLCLSLLSQESLRYRLLGSKGDISSWGHEYVRWGQLSCFLRFINIIIILLNLCFLSLLGIWRDKFQKSMQNDRLIRDSGYILNAIVLILTCSHFPFLTNTMNASYSFFFWCFYRPQTLQWTIFWNLYNK